MAMNDVNYLNDRGNANSFDSIKISLVSPDDIRSWSFGEVTSPDTVNYRTIKPENNGLFCCRIFGPVRDYECACGKYKRMKYRNVVCEKCGVEVTLSKTRRQRMGHIELAAPVVHIWFLRSLPSRISTILDLPLKEIEKVLYFESHIVLDPGNTRLERYTLMNDDELYDAQLEYGEDAFEAGIGAEAICYMLKRINLEEDVAALKSELLDISSETRRKKVVKRLKLLDDCLQSGNKPEWMVLNALPVSPPDLRPLVMLDGGRFATSDLNDLYRKVINRNNRLKRLIELKAPDIILRNEKRMLQESVDALFDNGRKGRVVKSNNKRPLKSLSDMLKGKQGRFRQNLLGKRVDYSGRSVIVVGPELKLHQCGLPKQMARELFKPFIYSKLEMYGMTPTLKASKKFVEEDRPEVWDILDDVIREHPVLLNRAPTLHRLGIQAFEPKLVEGKAIQLHPLVCSAFNADFDGDQMAVHVPLSLEARLEARALIMSTNNILSPANGKPIIVPSQDMILGLYYMTLYDKTQSVEKLPYFDSVAEVKHALLHKRFGLHTPIKYIVRSSDGKSKKVYDTCPGRVIVSDILPEELDDFSVINKVLNKKQVEQILDIVYRHCGQKKTVIFADRIMQVGFQYSSQSGISFGKDDVVIPKSKHDHINHIVKEVQEFEDQYSEGLITSGEKYNKVIDAWTRCTELVANDMMANIAFTDYTSVNDINNIYMMADSGAKGSPAQIKQLAGMRGPMTKPSGEIMETPIKSNFKEGLSVQEYFNSTHGARKGLTDTALKTANSGYLTRKLVDVSQDSIVTEYDCGTKEGIVYTSVVEGGEVIVRLSEVVLGRVAIEDIINPKDGSIITKADEIIDERACDIIDTSGIESLKVRSALTCESKSSICAKCYGRDLATGNLVNIGEAVGVIAAQSIGEPGTQLTMRTFHIGGAAQKSSLQSNIVAQLDGKVKLSNAVTVKDSAGLEVLMSRNCEIVIYDSKEVEKFRFKLPYGAKISVADAQEVKRGELLADWDPYTVPIITEKSGAVLFEDMKDSVSVMDIYDDATGLSSKVIMDWRQSRSLDLRPRILIDNDAIEGSPASGKKTKGSEEVSDLGYHLPVGAILSVAEGEKVSAGDVIARIPKESTKNKDITGGLPRVVELFEARKPKEQSIICEIEGIIEYGKDYKSKRKIIINPTDKKKVSVEYLIPRGKHISVSEGDYVSIGDTLMSGLPSLHDILRILGIEALSKYIINEIQTVYRLQGVKIDDKHIEVVLRRMLQKVEVVDPGETTFIIGEQIGRQEFDAINKKFIDEGFKPAVSTPVLQGITKASLQTNSFFSAASFQETTRVLTEAAVAGKVDKLIGLKESIIVGRLIPAGTGFYANELKKVANKLDLELQDQNQERENLKNAENSDTEGAGASSISKQSKLIDEQSGSTDEVSASIEKASALVGNDIDESTASEVKQNLADDASEEIASKAVAGMDNKDLHEDLEGSDDNSIPADKRADTDVM